MTILGIHCGFSIHTHEPGAALIKNGKIISVCEEERLIRVKNALGYLPTNSIKQVLGREPVINNGGGTSDGRFMPVMDAEIVELGPLNESIHKIDENVSVKDLEDLSKIYLEILNKLSISNS